MNLRFIQAKLHNNSVTAEEKKKLVDCQETLVSGKLLSDTQKLFLTQLKNRKYYR